MTLKIKFWKKDGYKRKLKEASNFVINLFACCKSNISLNKSQDA